MEPGRSALISLAFKRLGCKPQSISFLTGFRIAQDVEKEIPTAGLLAVHATADARLRIVGEHTGATLLDPFPDICGSGDGCSAFFGAGDPKFSDNVHLRPIFARERVRFLDPLLK